MALCFWGLVVAASDFGPSLLVLLVGGIWLCSGPGCLCGERGLALESVRGVSGLLAVGLL